MQSKNCCHSNLNETVLRVKGKDVTYSICSKCEDIWLDMEEVIKLNSEYDNKIKTQISDNRCPRCRDVFLEVIKKSTDKGLKISQCRKCSGIKIDSRGIGIVPEQSENQNPFEEFVHSLSRTFNKERNKKKK